MIQTFTRRALDALDRIYSITGSVVRTNAIDVSPPVLVHDVSREAEVSAGFFTNASLSITTAGAGANTFASLTREAFLATVGVVEEMAWRQIDPSTVDVWITGFWGIIAAADVGDFSRMRQGVQLGTLVGGGTVRCMKIYDVADPSPLVSGGTHGLRSSLPDEEYGAQLKPFILPDDESSAFLLEANDDAGGAMTVGGFWRCWIGPKGVLPPGA